MTELQKLPSWLFFWPNILVTSEPGKCYMLKHCSYLWFISPNKKSYLPINLQNALCIYSLSLVHNSANIMLSQLHWYTSVYCCFWLTLLKNMYNVIKFAFLGLWFKLWATDFYGFQTKVPIHHAKWCAWRTYQPPSFIINRLSELFNSQV